MNLVWHDADTTVVQVNTGKILVHDLYDSLNSQIVAEIHYKYFVIWSKKEDRNIIGLQSEKLKEYSVWVYKIYTLLYKKNYCMLLPLQLQL